MKERATSAAELQELLEAMDAVTGDAPVSPQALEQTTPNDQATPSDEDVQPILGHIEKREKQRKYAA